MIQYETSDSEFYLANKKYCESIEDNLRLLNIDCSGFCNSYGYDIIAIFEKNKLSYNIKIQKYQTTQNGIVIPLNAHDYIDSSITVKGLDRKIKVTFGKSILKRFFISQKLKKRIPSPYYINFNYSPNQNFVDELVENILEMKISKLKLNKGEMNCLIYISISDPVSLISKIEVALENWIIKDYFKKKY